MTRDTRRRALVCAFALAACLVTARPPQIVGDGGEYLVYALNFVELRGPSLRTRDLDGLKQEARDYAPHLEDETFYRSAVSGLGGRRDFMHFWFLSLLAAPFVGLAKAVGWPGAYGFVGLNLALLLSAVWVALPRLGVPATLLLFASPVIWWFDKAHPETFVVCLLAIGVLLVREKPWWSMIAAGAVATQYPPVVALIGVVAVVAVAFDRAWLRDRRFQAGAIAGGLLGILHPAYYLYRHGTPSLLLSASNSGAPTMAELSTVLLDANIGLFASFPVFPVVVMAALALLVRCRQRDLLDADVLVVAIMAAFFLWVFGVKDNVHHGATPSLSRYALWFIPLAIPLLRVERLNGVAWRRFLWIAALVSAPVSAFAFHPSVPDHGREPTWAADFVWRRLPSWSSPLPEIFSGTLNRTEDRDVPAATAGCEKILTGGPGPDGIFPIPCFPPPVPVPCSSRGVWCYANRTASGYRFERAPGRWNGVPVVTRETWPAGSEPVVRRFYEAWNWTTLRHVTSLPGLEPDDRVRMSILAGEDRFVLVLREPGEGATLTFTPSAPMSGVLVDARTGATLQLVQTGPAGATWEFPVPAAPDLLLLAMKR